MVETKSDNEITYLITDERQTQKVIADDNTNLNVFLNKQHRNFLIFSSNTQST